ncbi:MAG: hypothetical protein IJL39_00435, partial [Clostridia bacterium]|nr:hypothetical protein [Clostridia bacterium]
AREVADIAKTKTETVINAFQAGLMDRSEAMQELKKLSDETGLFESIAEDSIAAAAGQTYQDVTALKDPLAGIEEISAFDALPPVMSLDGGKGSGNFGHAGRPGKVGGSAQGGGSSSGASEKAFTSKSKEGKIKKTKYAPSTQQNYGAVQLNPEEYGHVCGEMETHYPSIQPGETVIVKHDKYFYSVTAAENGGLYCNKKWEYMGGRKRK